MKKIVTVKELETGDTLDQIFEDLDKNPEEVYYIKKFFSDDEPVAVLVSVNNELYS
jgi:hypothetical protein